MYSGTTLRTKSGLIMGVHQRIDRVAKRHVRSHVPHGIHFPTIQQILHFEGLNGPDGIKRKSPGQDEPWHFINPEDPNDTTLLDYIDDHIQNMAQALYDDNRERAAFEAAWMAHAIVDGLTPAHHYPLEEKLEELRGGENMSTRNSARKKLVMPGKNTRHTIKNNWEFWGTRGVMTTHLNFELGVATVISGAKLDKYKIDDHNIAMLRQSGFRSFYLHRVQQVYRMNMYDEFQKKGWTSMLARQTKDELIPLIINAVACGWYAAILRAEEL